ncbi:early responsive to dehydration 7, chloroplastic-like protein [Tanacetum coccineum]
MTSENLNSSPIHPKNDTQPTPSAPVHMTYSQNSTIMASENNNSSQKNSMHPKDDTQPTPSAPPMHMTSSQSPTKTMADYLNSPPRTTMCPKNDTRPTPSAPPMPSSSSSSDPNQPSSSSHPNQPSSSNPNQPSSSSPSSIYPNVEMKDLVENMFPDSPPSENSSQKSDSFEELIISVPGAYLHLIDKHLSVELAIGDFSIIQLRQGNNVVAILARVGETIQWPLAKDVACVKLDYSHYFFSIRAPKENEKDSDMLNYGLTFASKGQEKVLKEMDEFLDHYTSFSVQKVDENKGALDMKFLVRLSPLDLRSDSKKEEMGKNCKAYWTTLAPNVEDYSGTAAKLIAAGSGQLVKGILWCGDVTVDRLNWGNEILKIKMGPGMGMKGAFTVVSSFLFLSANFIWVLCSVCHILHGLRVKKVTMMTEKVAGGVLSGVLKVSGYFSSSVANSRLGKKFLKHVPGEMAIATLDGFSKVCEAFEVSGKNVLTTSSTVTTELVSHKYGEEAAKATNEGLDAAGHAVGAAWTVFKIRTAVNPRTAMAPRLMSKSGLHNETEDMRNRAIKGMKKDSPKKPKKSK